MKLEFFFFFMKSISQYFLNTGSKNSSTRVLVKVPATSITGASDIFSWKNSSKYYNRTGRNLLLTLAEILDPC